MATDSTSPSPAPLPPPDALTRAVALLRHLQRAQDNGAVLTYSTDATESFGDLPAKYADALESEIRALREDRELLDWLEDEVCDVCRIAVASDGVAIARWLVDSIDAKQASAGDTLREAIRADRAARALVPPTGA